MTLKRPMLLGSALSGLVLLSMSPFVSADILQDYQCTIERTAASQYVGGPQQKADERNYVGKIFTVSRRSGVMSGALKNDYQDPPLVIDHGSSEYGFKAISVLRGIGTGVSVINVAEYVDGPMKPFLYSSNEMVYFGRCVHF